MPRATSLGMPEDVDPEDLFVTDDAYVAGRRAFTEGMSVLENPMAHTGIGAKPGFPAGWTRWPMR